ncbi:MAG: HDOD domain-containing protein [Oceanobacter sp.]
MSISQIFAESRQLPHIPKVVQELIESFRDDNISAEAISNKVAMDQSLTAKVLRMANSAHYGASRTIATPQDAVVMLGFSKLRTMVLASGVTSSIKAPAGFDMNEFWRDGFAIAAIARWLADYAKDVDKETAFTCGMLHSIGVLLIHIVMPDQAAQIEDSVNLGGTRHLSEKAQLDFTSADVGAELAKRWKFPDEIYQAIAEQNNPDTEGEYSQMAGLIYLSRFLHRAHKESWSDEETLERFSAQTPTKC